MPTRVVDVVPQFTCFVCGDEECSRPPESRLAPPCECWCHICNAVKCAFTQGHDKRNHLCIDCFDRGHYNYADDPIPFAQWSTTIRSPDDGSIARVTTVANKPPTASATSSSSALEPLFAIPKQIRILADEIHESNEALRSKADRLSNMPIIIGQGVGSGGKGVLAVKRPRDSVSRSPRR